MYTVEQKFQIAQLWYQTKSPALVRHWSVAKLRGVDSSPPIGLKSMQNTKFLALLSLIFALKTKIPPPKVIRMRFGEEPEMMWNVRLSLHEDLFLGSGEEST